MRQWLDCLLAFLLSGRSVAPMDRPTRILLPLICAVVLTSCANQSAATSNKPQKRETFGKGWEADAHVNANIPAGR
jgi:hypothetical protein